jgi:hypothetical protein
MTSAAASSEDFELRGMWFRMWSSISSPMRLLIAPRAAARRCNASAQGSSSLSARSTLSSWPMTFLVRVTRSSFSREVCDIWLVYPMGVWYQRCRFGCNGSLHSSAMWRLISTSVCSGRRSSYGNRTPFTLQEAYFNAFASKCELILLLGERHEVIQ